MNDTFAARAIKQIPKQPQAQYSTDEQLRELYAAAARLGLYDAQDFLNNILNPVK